MIVACRRVVNLVGDIEGNLCLPVVVRRRVEDGVSDFVSQLEVGVFDGNAWRTGYAVVNGNQLDGIGQRGGGGGAHQNLRVPSAGRRGRYDAVGISRAVGFQNPINGETSGIDDAVPDASAHGGTIPVETEVHAGGVPFGNLVRVVASGVLR